MIGFAMFTRGHIHDTTIPVTIQSWGALDFFREVLKRDPADVSAMFELWAVSRERGKMCQLGIKSRRLIHPPGETGADTLLEMQKDCTEMITSGLRKSLFLSYTHRIG